MSTNSNHASFGQIKAEFDRVVTKIDALRARQGDLLNKRHANLSPDEHLEVQEYASKLADLLKDKDHFRSLLSNGVKAQQSPKIPLLSQFKANLGNAGIDRPEQSVLEKIVMRFPYQMMAAQGTPDLCASLYYAVNSLPSTATIDHIESQLHVSISSEVSLTQPNILYAMDFDAMRNILIKIIRVDSSTSSDTVTEHSTTANREDQVCKAVTKANIAGMVKCDVVRVSIQDTDQKTVSNSDLIAIKMRHYASSLAECSEFPENLVKAGFERIFCALKEFHKLGWVHMDVKPANVFVGDHLEWDLGDFGSARRIGENVISWTELINPYTIRKGMEAIAAMDMVQLCVLVAIELRKDQWSTELAGYQQHVQGNLVRERLCEIKDEEFRSLVVELIAHVAVDGHC
eukprot:jgi/Hompol1/1187/HPOL_005531-RA